MRVRGKKAPPSHKMTGGQPTPKPPAMPYTFPAPTNGWVLSENLATPPAASARVLDNWVCTTTGIRVRGGTVLHATVGAAVTRLFNYRAGAVEKLFAATASGIFDVTSPADPEAPPVGDVTGLSGGQWSTTMFGTAGGEFMMSVNGADAARYYNGSAWSATTITGVDTADLSYVWAYANRLFFVEGGALRFWYLPVASIGGAAASFSLSGVFKRGGTLLFGGRWSSDSGSGLDDRCVFVTTQGEVAVYQGIDPAADFQLVGVYDLPKPLGPDAHINAGGDLLIGTETGIIPITSAVQSDIAALSGQAVTQRIAPHWQKQARALAAERWEMAKVTNKNILVVTQPGTGDLLVANLQTGAWSRWTGLAHECIAIFNDQPYVGDDAGRVLLLDSGGSDTGTPYTCRFLGQFDPMGAPGMMKTMVQANLTFQAGSPFTAQLHVKADFDETSSPAPSSTADYAVDIWDVGEWDVAVWDASTGSKVSAQWQAVGATGRFLAPELQITFGIAPTPKVELVSVDAQFYVGAAVT